MKNRMIWTSALLASAFGMLLTGCKSSVPAPGEAPIVESNAAATDPTMANFATPVNSGVTRVAASSYNGPQQQGYAETYPQQSAPAPNYGTGNSQQNEAYQYNTQQPASQGNPQADQAEYDQYASLLDPNVPEATQPPPPLPSDYEQPEAPGPDYLWTPGYWDYATAGYYYVPGSWVAAPYPGALWTPGWWGFVGGHYGWHRGYWGRHVGYYGGINYGFGYIGFGYQGGYWNGDHFWYNRAVLRVNPRVVGNNYYQRNITVNNREYVNNTRISYFGGNGGLRRPPAPQEFAAIHEPHTPPMQAQLENRRAAESNRQQFFSANNGRPQMMYASHPLPADRNIQAPPRTMPQQNVEQQRIQQQQQANVQQREQNLQQRNENLQQRNGIEQQRNGQMQAQQQANIQREQQMNAQRQGGEAQRNQGMQLQNQQHAQEEQQRNQQLQQRNQQEQQRNQQQANVQHEQQMNAQRQQAEAQRQQGEAQRNQGMQANQQREQQANAQREQQQNAQREQQQQQQNAQREQQANAQREQQANAQRQQAMAQQHAQAAAPRPAPQPQHVEAPHPAPAPHVEAPHPAPPPAAHGGGGAPEHRR